MLLFESVHFMSQTFVFNKKIKFACSKHMFQHSYLMGLFNSRLYNLEFLYRRNY